MEFIKKLEEEAMEQLSEIAAARTYQGSNPEYKQKAKTALGVIGAYVRLRATIANERTNELITIRMQREMAGSSTPEGRQLATNGV